MVAEPTLGERTMTVDSVTKTVTGEVVTQTPSTWVIRRYGRRKHAVAFTFDDGPDGEWTPDDFLDTLESRGVSGDVLRHRGERRGTPRPAPAGAGRGHGDRESHLQSPEPGAGGPPDHATRALGHRAADRSVPEPPHRPLAASVFRRRGAHHARRARAGVHRPGAGLHHRRAPYRPVRLVLPRHPDDHRQHAETARPRQHHPAARRGRKPESDGRGAGPAHRLDPRAGLRVHDRHRAGGRVHHAGDGAAAAGVHLPALRRAHVVHGTGSASSSPCTRSSWSPWDSASAGWPSSSRSRLGNGTRAATSARRPPRRTTTPPSP